MNELFVMIYTNIHAYRVLVIISGYWESVIGKTKLEIFKIFKINNNNKIK